MHLNWKDAKKSQRKRKRSPAVSFVVPEEEGLCPGSDAAQDSESSSFLGMQCAADATSHLNGALDMNSHLSGVPGMNGHLNGFLDPSTVEISSSRKVSMGMPRKTQPTARRNCKDFQNLDLARLPQEPLEGLPAVKVNGICVESSGT